MITNIVIYIYINHFIYQFAYQLYKINIYESNNTNNIIIIIDTLNR